MSTVLYIVANPKTSQESFSQKVGDYFLQEYRKQHPDSKITVLDLYSTSVPFLDEDHFTGWKLMEQGIPLDQMPEPVRGKMTVAMSFIDALIEHDHYIMVTPFWNLGIPGILKSFIDLIVVAGKTFKFTEKGSEGLLTGKKALHIQSRGGTFSEGPYQDFEYGDRYLRTLFGFLGVRDFQSLIIEGTSQFPEKTDLIVADALEKARKLAVIF